MNRLEHITALMDHRREERRFQLQRELREEGFGPQCPQMLRELYVLPRQHDDAVLHAEGDRVRPVAAGAVGGAGGGGVMGCAYPSHVQPSPSRPRGQDGWGRRENSLSGTVKDDFGHRLPRLGPSWGVLHRATPRGATTTSLLFSIREREDRGRRGGEATFQGVCASPPGEDGWEDGGETAVTGTAGHLEADAV